MSTTSDTWTLVEQAIDLTSRRELDADKFTPWQIMHALVALRGDLTLVKNGQQVNAVEWVSKGARFWKTTDPTLRGSYWFEATPYGGRAQPFNGTPYEFEGHSNQFLAIMAMSNLPLDHQFLVAGNRTLTMANMVRHAQMAANENEEITWTLWFLTQYLDPDSRWVNAKGENWSMERLVQLQIQSEVTKSPCGGTHGLFALAYIRNSYLQKHGQLRGIWMSADMKVQQHIAMSKALQNADGSFSTMHFKGRGHSDDFNERIKYSGHQLEWLMMALPHNRLDEEWVQRGIRALALDMVVNASQPADCGPLYHSLNALKMYHDRVAPSRTQQTPEQLAQTPAEAAPQVKDTPMEQPRELPTIDPSAVAVRPLTPESAPTKPEVMIERPVPELPQPELKPPVAIAQAKPSITEPPSAPSTGGTPLVRPSSPIRLNPAEPALTATPTQPQRVAALPEEDVLKVAPLGPRTRSETSAPDTEDSRPPLPEVERPAASAEMRPTIVPPAEITATEAEPIAAPAKRVRRTDRPFVPFAPDKLKDKATGTANELPDDDGMIEEPADAPLLGSGAAEE
ncbi:MAG: hypothetical protein KDA58_05570 [Planctomycetaceae bacterium]|nr:hypothetical protein [Planctomycetaceae bacterium]